MSRSGYSDDYDDQWALICWRGAVASALKGRRGQAFLKEMLAALDALPEKKLIAHELEERGDVCAIGAVGKQRGIDMSKLDPEDPETVAGCFGIAGALTKEILFENDQDFAWRNDETPEARFTRMRAWVVANIRQEPEGVAAKPVRP